MVPVDADPDSISRHAKQMTPSTDESTNDPMTKE